MALWDLKNPPKAKLPGDSENVVDDSGWLDPDNSEIKVAIRHLHKKRKKYLDEKLNQWVLEDGSGFFLMEDSDSINLTDPNHFLTEDSVLGQQENIDNLPNNYSEDPKIMNVSPYRHRHS